MDGPNRLISQLIAEGNLLSVSAPFPLPLFFMSSSSFLGGHSEGSEESPYLPVTTPGFPILSQNKKVKSKPHWRSASHVERKLDPGGSSGLQPANRHAHKRGFSPGPSPASTAHLSASQRPEGHAFRRAANQPPRSGLPLCRRQASRTHFQTPPKSAATQNSCQAPKPVDNSPTHTPPATYLPHFDSR